MSFPNLTQHAIENHWTNKELKAVEKKIKGEGKKYNWFQRIIQVVFVSTLLIWLLYVFLLGIIKLVGLF